MNWKTILAAGAMILFTGTIYAQTPDGETPANEGVCDGLVGATPGLYGLCVAFCEAQDCEPDFLAADPFAKCKASSPKILAAYDRKKRADDPDMPCIMTGCPCFTAEEVEEFNWPPGNDNYEFCASDGVIDSPAGYGERSAIITGFFDDPDHQIVAASEQYLYHTQDWQYLCVIGLRDREPWLQRFQYISASEQYVCRNIINTFIESKGGCPQ